MHHEVILRQGLRTLVGFEPSPNFRFEDGVSLGACEIFPGVAFGLHSYMNSGIVRSQVVVGRYCSIGRGVTIGSGAHDHNALSTSPFFRTNSNPPIVRWANEARRIRVLIGNDVWIGDNAYIMSGVNVGDGAIIAAGSVVTRDVPPYSVVAGVPAKQLRIRFSDDIVNRLLLLRWHEFSPDRLRHIDIGSIESCLEQLETWPEEARTVKAIVYKNINEKLSPAIRPEA